MINIKCPYSPLEMMTTMVTFPDYGKEVQEKAGALIMEGLGKLTPPEIAKGYGITTLDLVNSPNFDTIMKAEAGKIVHGIARELVSQLGMTDREAWAILMALSNPEFMERGHHEDTRGDKGGGE